METLTKRLELWKKNKKVFDYEDCVSSIKNEMYEEKNGNLKYTQVEREIEECITFSIKDLENTSENMQDYYNESLELLKEKIFFNIDFHKLEILYNYSSREYYKIIEKTILYFLNLFEKVNILVSHLGEKSIYFNNLDDLLSDFSFYENLVLQIENLLEEVKNSKFLLQPEKDFLLSKLIPYEIVNMDYLFNINKYFYRGKFTSYSLKKELRDMYLERFQELCLEYQNYINLKIIPFPLPKDIVEIKIRQLNIKNKYNVVFDKEITPNI